MLKGEAPSPEMSRGLIEFLVRQGILTSARLDPSDHQYLLRSLARHLHTSYFDYDEGPEDPGDL